MPKGNGQTKRRKKQRLDVLLPLPALSTNKLFLGRKRRSYHYKNFRSKVFAYLDEHYDKSIYSLKGNLSLKMEVGFSSPLSDLSNSIKAIEDCLVSWIGNNFDDRQIARITLDKYLVDKGEEYMDISICKLRRNIDRRTKYVKGKRKKRI